MEDRVCKLVLDSIIETKGKDVVVIDISKVSFMADFMIICNGTSKAHTTGISGYILEQIKKNDIKVFGMNGLDDGKWVLIDLGTVIVHVMLPESRDFYTLEKLWSNGEIIYYDEQENLSAKI